MIIAATSTQRMETPITPATIPAMTPILPWLLCSSFSSVGVGDKVVATVASFGSSTDDIIESTLVTRRDIIVEVSITGNGLYTGVWHGADNWYGFSTRTWYRIGN